MPEACEVVVYVRTRRVVAAAREDRWFLTVSYAPGMSSRVPFRVLTIGYRRRLDAGQREALERAYGIAAATGSAVRVVDLGRTNPLFRFLRTRLLRVRSVPVVVVKGPCAWGPSTEGGAPQTLADVRPDRRTRAAAGAP